MKVEIRMLCLLSAILCGCGGGGDDPDSESGTPDNGAGLGTTLQNSRCSKSTSGPSGAHTCKDLQRIGGLALNMVRLNSLSFSMAHERAASMASLAGSQDCPVSGSVRGVLSGVQTVTLTLSQCDFGLGPFNGTVRTARRANLQTFSDLTIDVTVRGARYQTVGTVSSLSDSLPQVSANGSLAVGSAMPILVDVLSAFVPNSDGSLGAGFQSSLRIGTATAMTLNNGSGDGSERILPNERGGGFVIVDMPFSGFVPYRRIFSDPPNLRFDVFDARLAVQGRSISGRIVNFNTNASEPIASTWDAVMASPRYDFAD